MTSTLSPLPFVHNACSSLSLGNGVTLGAQVDFRPIPNPLNLQQVGEEVEGIVMLSLLKQRLETFTECIRNGSPVPSEDSETDGEEKYRRHNLTTPTGRKRRASFGDSLSKRSKSELEHLQEDTRTWMEMFNVAKRCTGFTRNSNESFRELRRSPSDLQVQTWVQKQTEMKTRGLLSEERIELLKLIGIDVSEPIKKNQYKNHRDSSSEEDEFEDESSEREDLTVNRRKRNSLSISIPTYREPSKSTVSPSKRGGVPLSTMPSGKKKANLKRNSLHNWVYNQRRLESEGNLPIHRKKLLDKIDFDWKLGAKGDEQSSQEEIVSSRSSSPVPMMAAETKLEIQGDGNALPYDIPNSKSEDLWMSRYKELIEFKTKHGNFEVPRYAE